METFRLKEYICNYCHQVFSWKSELDDHMVWHVGQAFPLQHNKIELTGEGDEKGNNILTYAPENRLDTQGLNHFSDKQCYICYKLFSSKDSMKNHMKLHTGERPYSCNVCGKKFMRSSDLNIHVRKHTGEKPYDCEICDKRFASLSSLNKHYNSHTGEKLYDCKHCSQKFSHRDTLVRHLRYHLGMKPFSCENCGKSFEHRGTLYHHTKNCQNNFQY